MRARAGLTILSVALTGTTWACDLCAIYNANSALGDSGQGLSFTVSEQFVPFHTLQRDGHERPNLNDDFVDSSITHLVPTWNFSDRFGISLNVPVVYRSFDRLKYTPTFPASIVPESGHESGLGDISLIGRITAFRHLKAKTSFIVNLLAGVKFPTGDADRLEEEVELFEAFDFIYGPDHPQDLHTVSGVHSRDLTLGSGSYDGVFGATVNTRWLRLFANAQVQYYLRTSGESGYEIGDELMISGGPGVFVFLEDMFTIGVQCLATYDRMWPDHLLGRDNENTGMTAIYLGPQVIFTWSDKLSVNAGLDLPLDINNDGLQNVPDWRFHGGISWRF